MKGVKMFLEQCIKCGKKIEAQFGEPIICPECQDKEPKYFKFEDEADGQQSEFCCKAKNICQCCGSIHTDSDLIFMGKNEAGENDLYCPVCATKELKTNAINISLGAAAMCETLEKMIEQLQKGKI